ncbi:FAD binding domain protein [Halenospora varia]|nr:FAD binding domain protein [Halenospora varia]
MLPITRRGEAPKEEYERARVGRVFNQRRPERYPTAVVEATEEEHIVDAVKLAQKEGIRVSIRSGGHSWAAWSVRDNAVLIDLGNYKQVEFDESTGIVAVSPSTTGRQLNDVLRKKGLLFPGGHCPDVGLGGFLLQGGMGWVCKSWGWACQYVKAIDVVTAEGKKLHCDEQENQDLFWAARGAGPGFPAVVTRFYLKPKPLPTHVRTSGYVFPKEDFKKAQNWVQSISPTFDKDTEIVCVGLFMPDYEESVVIVSFTSFKWSDVESMQALQAAEDSVPSGYLQRWFNRPTTLQKEYEMQGRANPEGHRYCADNVYVNNDSDVASVLEESFTTLPSRKSFALWFSMAPISQRPLPDMAVSMQSDHYFALYTIWEESKDDDRCQSWVKGVMSRIAPHGVGQYLGDSDFQVRNTKYWGEEQGKKLMEVRRKWDPQGKICGYLDEGDTSGVNGLANNL